MAPSPEPIELRPLKILHVVERFSSGIFETLRQIVTVAAQSGDEVHIAHGVNRWTPDHFASQFPDTVVFYRLAWDDGRRPGTLVRAGAQLAALVRHERFNVVHLHSTVAGLTGALLVPRGTMTVYTPHGYMFLMSSLPRPIRGLARVMEALVGRRVSTIGAVSEAEAAEARRLGIRRVSVVHNGIAELDDLLDRRPAKGDVTGRSGVVAAGRMSPARQPGAVADLFELLPKGMPTAWIGDAGDSDASARFTANGTELTGWVSRSEVLERTRKARVYLHWSAWDGYPLSILEAIATGTVVVGSDIPPVREILGERWVAASVVSGAQLVGQLLTDDELYATAQAEQAYAGAPFSGRRMASHWRALYASLATGATSGEAADRAPRRTLPVTHAK